MDAIQKKILKNRGERQLSIWYGLKKRDGNNAHKTLFQIRQKKRNGKKRCDPPQKKGFSGPWRTDHLSGFPKKNSKKRHEGFKSKKKAHRRRMRYHIDYHVDFR